MNKIKSGLLLLIAGLFFSTIIKAQGIDEGRSFLYYERYKSAVNVFSKLVAADPKNVEAAYWLGQAYIGQEDVAAAKALYQKTLMENPNSPLLIAGMGHVELLEGKIPDARNRFETAISLSQGKNIAVLNAVGFANVDAKGGDAAYAVDKLKQASVLKGMKDPDVFVNLGDAYRKIGDGGNAILAYQSALTLKPNYARASYRIGKLYQTQGEGQRDIYTKYYDEAIAKDPTYAPVYYNLYDYYYNTDVGKSAAYLDKYIANTDDDPKNCYYRASMKYAQGLFQESIAEADKCIAASPEPYPNLYGLKGYAYNRLGDSVNAKVFFDQYLSKQKIDKINPNDYIGYANILMKFTGNDSLAGTYIDKAVALDTVEANKVGYLKTIATYYDSKKMYGDGAAWHKKILDIKQNVTKTELYNAGYGFYRSGKYQEAIAVFARYSQKFPEDAFGYYMAGKSYWGIDSTMTQGLANPSFEKAIEVGSVDSVKYKPQLIGSYKYMVAYNANIKKDKAAAIAYCDKILALDPADAEALANKEVISKMGTKPAATPKPATGAKTGTKTGTAPKKK